MGNGILRSGRILQDEIGCFRATRGIILVNVRVEGFPPCKLIRDAAKISVVINGLQALANDFLVRRESGLFQGMAVRWHAWNRKSAIEYFFPSVIGNVFRQTPSEHLRIGSTANGRTS